MKKLLGIVVLCLLCCNVGVAEKNETIEKNIENANREGAVVFLSSDAASMITGTSLSEYIIAYRCGGLFTHLYKEELAAALIGATWDFEKKNIIQKFKKNNFNYAGSQIFYVTTIGSLNKNTNYNWEEVVNLAKTQMVEWEKIYQKKGKTAFIDISFCKAEAEYKIELIVNSLELKLFYKAFGVDTDFDSIQQ